MSQYRIVHTTGYSYPDGATASFNEARMTPLSSRRQLVLSSRLEIQPVAWQLQYRDYWGTSAVAFEVHEPHDMLRVVATSTVDIHSVEREAGPVGWDGLLDDAVRDKFEEMLTPTDYVVPHRDVAKLARSVRESAEDPGAAVIQIVERIRQRVNYIPGITQVQTRAREVWEHGAGVCQDLAHLTLGALRSIGIPARYVSGYVVQKEEPPVGETMVGESHAWIQFWDGDWRGYDPTNQREPMGTHVEVAVGRDYADVTPLKGIYTGGAESSMFVAVEMTRLT